MNIICNGGVDIPQLSEENCEGVYISSQCIINPNAITALNLPVNSSLNTIINALVLGLIYKEEQITSLQAQIDALTP